MSIDIKDRKPEALAALYNASKPQGMGILHHDQAPMTLKEATILLEDQTYFDYLKGRIMKVNFKEDTFDPSLYDRDNGQGAAARAVATC